MSTVEPTFLEHAGDATRLLAKRRELFDAKERLAAEKEKYEERCSSLDLKEEYLKDRDLAFQRRLLNLKLFAEERQLKQERLAKRLEEEVQACEDLDAKAATLSKTLEVKQQELKRLQELAASQDLGGSDNATDLSKRTESLTLPNEVTEVELQSVEAETAAQAEKADSADTAGSEDVPSDDSKVTSPDTANVPDGDSAAKEDCSQ
ncbi:hypothetical protein ACHAXT_009274 [Thalassiosira profunda]